MSATSQILLDVQHVSQQYPLPKAALLPTQLKLPVQRQMIAVMAPSCK